MKESDLIFGLMRSIKKKEYSFSDIEWLTAPFKVTETCLRSNLSRMVLSNILQVRKEGRKAFYFFTEKSDKLGSNVSMAFHPPDWSEWNGEWWGISISVPENEKKERYKIHKKLAHYRFAALHPGFWIRPMNKLENIEFRLKDVLESKFCKVMHFNFFSDYELENVPSIWNVRETNKRFKECIQYIEKCYDEYNLDIPSEALRGKMIIGDTIVKQLAVDPLLPDQFLPSNWQGDNLRKVFYEWMGITTEKSRPYWGKILEINQITLTQNTDIHGKTYKLAP